MKNEVYNEEAKKVKMENKRFIIYMYTYSIIVIILLTFTLIYIYPRLFNEATKEATESYENQVEQQN